MRFWRITRRRFASNAATGEGARLYGGRWNSRGVRVVYASTSLALAAVETFVNIDPGLRPGDLVKRKEWTQVEGAKSCGVTQPRINDLLRDRVSRFSLDALVNISTALGCRVRVDLEAA